MFSFPGPIKMFQFRPSPFANANSLCWEVPLGHSGFKGRMRLPQTYRSLPRPSSVSEPSHPPCSVADPLLQKSGQLAYDVTANLRTRTSTRHKAVSAVTSSSKDSNGVHQVIGACAPQHLAGTDNRSGRSHHPSPIGPLCLVMSVMCVCNRLS